MKRNWELDELIESWTLLPHELALLDSKIGVNRLGFAVLLKFFELAHKFPSSPQDVPWEVVSYIAQQVNVPAQEYVNYDWNGRSMMRHRGEIRRWLGIRTCSSDDIQGMVDWLTNQVLGQELEIERLMVAVEERFLLLKIEPPTRGRTERLIRSAIRTYESNFFALIHQKLSSQSRAAINTLLKTSDSEDEANSNFSVFYYLNSEPGRATLDSFLSEISKLEHLRKIGLSNDLFANISPKVLQTYVRRAATEPPRELRAHPHKILVAAFCWQRMREVTDNLVDLLIQIVHGIARRATKKVDAQLIQDFKRVSGKHNLLY